MIHALGELQITSLKKKSIHPFSQSKHPGTKSTPEPDFFHPLQRLGSSTKHSQEDESGNEILARIKKERRRREKCKRKKPPAQIPWSY
jgi:hypothetical protein